MGLALRVLQGHAALARAAVGAGGRAGAGLGDPQHARVYGAEVLVDVLGRGGDRDRGGLVVLQGDGDRLAGEAVVARVVAVGRVQQRVRRYLRVVRKVRLFISGLFLINAY